MEYPEGPRLAAVTGWIDADEGEPPEVWRVSCLDCDMVLEAGRGDPFLRQRREQLPCPRCGSYRRELQQRREGGYTHGEWPESLAPLAARDVPRQDGDDDEDGYERPSHALYGLGIAFQYDGGAVRQQVLREQPELIQQRDPRVPEAFRALGEAYGVAVEQGLTSATGSGGWRAPRGDGEGGGGPGGFDVAVLAGEAIDELIRLGGVAGGIFAIRAGLKWLVAKSGRPVAINEGGALVAAWAHLAEAYGVSDPALAFVTQIRSKAVPYAFEGFAVGLRSDDAMWYLTVNFEGRVVTTLRDGALPPLGTTVIAEGAFIDLAADRERLASDEASQRQGED